MVSAIRYDKHKNTFGFKRTKFEKNLKGCNLDIEFIAQTVRWINYVYRINKKERNIYSFLSDHDTQETNDLMYHIRCETIQDYFCFENKLRDSDIVIATDASRDPDENLTGIGIFIKDHNKFYRYAEPLGSVSNSFGELFAIGKVKFLLDFFQIDTTNRRIIIMTDSLCSFCPLITPPKNIDKQIKYPTLFKQTQTFLKHKQVVLWKIRSHTDKINIREIIIMVSLECNLTMVKLII